MLCAVVPLALLATVVQRETRARVAEQFEGRVRGVSAAAAKVLDAELASIDDALSGIVEAMNDDNRFRASVLGDSSQRAFLLDYAGDAMRRGGLDALVIQSSAGRILSSGHFRNDYDRDAPALGAAFPARQQLDDHGIVLAKLQRPEGGFLALVRPARLTLGDAELLVVGGTEIDASFVSRLSTTPTVRVDFAGVPADLKPELAGEVSTPGAPAGFELPATFVDATARVANATDAAVRLVHDATPLDRLLSDLNRWFLVVLVSSTAGAVVLAFWLSDRMSRPIVDLARRTERVDMNRLNESFRSTRNDEVGLLASKLGEMTRRLRESAATLREAERRATLGDISRQVNHDIRNGLTPIRNVVRHLSELADADPAQLARVYAERKNTLESSIEYLETLATHYARLAPRARAVRCDVADVARQVVEDLRSEPGADVVLRGSGGAFVSGDPVSVRRLIENLARNALQSGEPGRVRVSMDVEVAQPPGREVILRVSDNGRGMSEATRTHIFDDFFSMRPDGTGLGLSIVRRVVTDMNGTIAVESDEGKGTTVTVSLPYSEG